MKYAALCLWFFCNSMFAAEFITLDVSRDGKTFVIDSDQYIVAPVDAVRDVMTNFDDYHRLSSIFKRTDVTQENEKLLTLVTHAEGCITFFCKRIEKTEHIAVSKDHAITAIIDGDVSDFSDGQSYWTFDAYEQGTLMSVTASMTPKFWVPPVIGTWAVKRTLKKDALDAMHRIETLALDPNARLDTDAR